VRRSTVSTTGAVDRRRVGDREATSTAQITIVAQRDAIGHYPSLCAPVACKVRSVGEES
jgi:hypothetical protein